MEVSSASVQKCLTYSRAFCRWMHKEIVQKAIRLPYGRKANNCTRHLGNQNPLTFSVRIKIGKLMMVNRHPRKSSISRCRIQAAKRLPIRFIKLTNNDVHERPNVEMSGLRGFSHSSGGLQGWALWRTKASDRRNA